MNRINTYCAAEKKLSGKYPELDSIADSLSESVCVQINNEASAAKSEMPYRAQYILEEVIKRLETAV